MLFSPAVRAGHAPLVPEPRTLLLREDDPSHLVIGARRGGYFVTRDAGATWSWMCEAGVGYDDEEVYPGALLPGGTLVVSTGFGGVAASVDGCGFTPWLPSEQPFVADVRARPSPGPGVVALEARGLGDGFFNQLWQSEDGFRWRELGAPLAPDELATSFAISNDGGLFVGTSGSLGAALWRSFDSGTSWARATVTTEPGVAPRVIGAHGVSDDARVFVVADAAQAEDLSTEGDRALLSSDGGRTFFEILSAAGHLASWALSSDGERLAVGGHTDGIHLLRGASTATATATMTRVWERSVHALAWSASGRLYAAGHEAIDGFSVGVSEDDGRSFRSVFALCQVQGPLTCGAGTSVGAQCSSAGETGWEVRKEVVDDRACNSAAAAGAGGLEAPGDAPVAGVAGGATAPDRAEPACAIARGASGAGGGAWTCLAVFAWVSKNRRRNAPRAVRGA